MSTLRKTLLLGVLMLLCFTAGAFAANGLQKVEAYLGKDISVTVDGRNIKLDQPVLIYDNFSYLPMREVGSLLGAGVDWEESSKTILLTSAGPTPEPSYGVDYSDLIQFSAVVKYKTTKDGITYPLLGNQHNGVLYFRRADIIPLGIDLSGLLTVKEIHTSDIYISAEELSQRWQNPQIELVRNEALIYETDFEKIKTIKGYLYLHQSEGTAHYVQPLNLPDEYEVLYQQTDGRFYMHHIKLVVNPNGSYYVGSSSGSYIYE